MKYIFDGEFVRDSESPTGQKFELISGQESVDISGKDFRDIMLEIRSELSSHYLAESGWKVSVDCRLVRVIVDIPMWIITAKCEKDSGYCSGWEERGWNVDENAGVLTPAYQVESFRNLS